MNMIIGKKQIIMAALVAALGLAVFANWYYVGSGDKQDALTVGVHEDSQEAISAANAQPIVQDTDTQGYFETARLQKMNARDEAIEVLQNVIDSCDASSDAAKTAVQEMNTLNAGLLLETDLENMIKATVGGECICCVEENGIDVVISDDCLNDDAVLAISDIINASCGTVENIRITGA